MKQAGTRAVSLFLIVVLLASMCVVPASAEGDGVTTYRVLEFACPGSNLGNYPGYDCDHLTSALTGALNVSAENITKVTPDFYADSSSVALSYFKTAFQSADDDDINIFFYSGHGSYNSSKNTSSLCTTYYSNYWLNADNIKTYIQENNIRGKFIIMADACHSGGMISKSIQGDGEEEDLFIDHFAESFTESFAEDTAESSMESTSLDAQEEATVTKGSFNGSDRYKVIAAASTMQYSYQWSAEYLSGIFTTSLVTGIGYSPSKNSYSSYPADTDNDGTVTVAELFRWTKQTCTQSLVCGYPENDQTPVLRYNRTKYAGAHLLRFSVSPSTLPLSESAELTVTYETDTACTLTVEAPLSDDGSVRSLKYPDSTMGYSSSNFGYPYSSTTLPAGTKTARGTYQKTTTLTINTNNLQSYVYYLRVTTNAASGNSVVLVPIQITTNTKKPDFAVELNPSSAFEAMDETDELRVRVTFGTTVRSTTPPSSNVTLYTAVLDEEGQVVRTLADWLPGTFRLNTDLGTSSNPGYEAINDFYWDGKDQEGEYVYTGQYTIRVIGRYYTGESNNPYEDVEITKTIQVTTPSLHPYTVSFYEGEQLVATATVLSGKKASAPAGYSTTREGYKLLGWYTADGSTDWGTKWDFAKNTVTGDLQLYARWGVCEGIYGVAAGPGGQLTVSVGAEKSGNIYVAEYSAGQMVQIVAVAVAAQNTLQSVDLGLKPRAQHTYLVLLTDSDFKPVGEAASYAAPA